MTASDTHQAIDAVFRIEQAKLIAGLTRMVRDVGVAEELAQERWSSRSSNGPNRASPTSLGPG
jgi:predicted RNA polymerase sigma factor